MFPALLRSIVASRSVLAFAAVLVAMPVPAPAQEFPAKPLRIIAPNPPGGGFDLVARIVAQGLGDALGQQVIVENRTGAGTLVGTEAAAKAPADGYTLLVGGLSNIAINVGLYRKLPYDPLVDFVPVAMVSGVPYMLVARKDMPQSSLRELVEFARGNPGKLTFASGGVGTGQHIAGAVLAHVTKADMLHVPYKGAQAAYQDLLSGRVDLFFDNAGTALNYLQSGQVRAYAVSVPTRWSGAASVPTVNETGVGDMDMNSWFGIFTQAKTPAGVLERLRAGMAKVNASSDVRARLEKSGSQVMVMAPAATEAFVRSEIQRWSALIRAAGIAAE